MNQHLYNTIFSDKSSHRWKRHFYFWLAIYLYHLLRIGLMYPSLENPSAIRSVIVHAFVWGTIPNLVWTYSIVYYLIPRYFDRKKYLSFVIGIIILMGIIQTYGFLQGIIISNKHFKDAIGMSRADIIANFRPGFIRLLGNPPLIFGLFLSLKILKNWHLEQLKTAMLEKENTNAELQLLKAQVHPHFLFNTLNNIYSFTLTRSPLAGALVEKLSGMLNYMINECKEPLVPLDREIKLIRDYIGLEKVRYGTRLTMMVEIKGDSSNKMIAPLLMIPFVENCFKHGASVMRGQQWIKLDMRITRELLDFKLSNSKPADESNSNKKAGIGLTNVQKRLQLLYPGKHVLITESSNDSYSVHLQVSLQTLIVPEHNNAFIQILQPI